MSIKLHLGCGTQKRAGWINVDCCPHLVPDALVDLSLFPWPWGNNTVEELFSHHVFEHLPDTVKTMEECYRILVPGGTIECIVPFALNFAYFQDPTHRRPWTDVTVDYFVRGDKNCSYTTKMFELVFKRLLSDGIAANGNKAPITIRRMMRNAIPFRNHLKHLILGMYDEVHFKLRKPYDD